MEPSNGNSSVDVDDMEAYLLALEGKPEEALLRLGAREDPESLLRRLEILLEGDRFDEAAALVHGRIPHERWCEQAVAALAATGEFEEAERLVNWAHGLSDMLLWRLCLIALAKHRFLHALKSRDKQVPVLSGELTPTEQKHTRLAKKDLEPLVATVRAQKRILTGIDASAVALAMEFEYYLGAHDEAAALADLLWARKPLPLNYAFAAIRKTVKARDELPERLRTERSDSYEAKRLAALVEGTLLKKPKEAIQAAELLLDEYKSPDHQRQTAFLLLQLSGTLPEEEAQTVRKRAESLIDPSGPYARFRRIQSWLKDGRFADARAALEQSPEPDHPGWLELMAEVNTGEGRHDQAVDLLIQATDRMPEEQLLRKAAVVASKFGRVPAAITLLERLLRVDPDDIATRSHLGDLLVQVGNYDRAAEEFRRLRKLDPANATFGLNEAVCQARCLRLDESLQIYEELCSSESVEIGAVVGRATLLKMMNRAADGFASLKKHKEAFWGHPDFLKIYIDLGYAAKREDEAHQGFLRLHQLQGDGSIEQEIQTLSIDDIVKMLGRSREDAEILGGEMLRGNCSWLLADRPCATSAISAFLDRTMSLDWLSEEPISRARKTVYSTNGYVAIERGNGKRASLEPIHSPESGQAIVVDLTSLMTIHRLGLLSDMAAYFGQCYYPSDYRAASLRDLNRLGPHQPSRYEAARNILTAIEVNRILVDETKTFPFLHEHRPENHEPAGEHSYAFVDLVTPLKQTRLLTDKEAMEFESLARKKSGVGDGYTPLQVSTDIRIHPSSLETLCQHALLGPILSSFRVHISPGDLSSLRNYVAAWEEVRDSREQHESLWKAIKSDDRFIPVPHSLPAQLRTPDEVSADSSGNGKWLPLYSTFIALDRNLPLLVDDRSCQMLVHHSCRRTTASFGTDALLTALLQSGKLTADAGADAYLHLMRWRFRFFVVPTAVMVALAKSCLGNPPGLSLMRIARYVQDCMRDPGLFGGPEATDPPNTMAERLFSAWTGAVSEFVMAIWSDSTIPEDAAEALSKWALTECLPAPPQALGLDSRVLANLQSRACLFQAFILSAKIRQPARANRALVAIARAFGIGTREYLEELAEVVDAI